MKNSLLAEAICDAKAVKAIALENAKIAMAEAFTPRIQAMLEKKIREEESEDTTVPTEVSSEITDEVPMEPVSTEAPVSDVPMESPEATEAPVSDVPSAVPTEAPVAPAVPAECPTETPVAPVTDDSTEAPVEMEAPVAPITSEGEEKSDVDSELEAILKELEADATNVDEDVDIEIEPESGTEKENGELKLDDDGEGDMEDEINLDELLSEIEKSVDDDGDVMVNKKEEQEEIKEANAKIAELEEQLAEYRDGVVVLRNKLNEVNLLNAKLLYTNKLFKGSSLTSEQKVKVIESFDRSKDIREVKLVYTTLAESFKKGSKTPDNAKKAIVAEGIASKLVASTKPLTESVTPVLTEENVFTARMKVLAGITPKK